jgi:outer membrane immunogenic protein
MKRLLVGTVSLLALGAFAGTANAQMPNFFSGPAVNWTGPYAGVEGGYGWGSAEQTDPSGFDSGRYSTSGGLVGGTLGYNWELPNHIVLGGETDLSWADIGGDSHFNGCGASYCTSKLEMLGTARGRVGFSFGRVMPFVTGGLAYGDIHGKEGLGYSDPYGSGTTLHTGWTAGGGVEAALAPKWSAKAEYLYTDLGSGRTFTDHFSDGSTLPENVRLKSNIFRVGLNYKFW